MTITVLATQAVRCLLEEFVQLYLRTGKSQRQVIVRYSKSSFPHTVKAHNVPSSQNFEAQTASRPAKKLKEASDASTSVPPRAESSRSPPTRTRPSASEQAEHRTKSEEQAVAISSYTSHDRRGSYLTPPLHHSEAQLPWSNSWSTEAPPFDQAYWPDNLFDGFDLPWLDLSQGPAPGEHLRSTIPALQAAAERISQPSIPPTVQTSNQAIFQKPYVAINDSVIGSLIQIFLDRLHMSMPFFKRSYLINNLNAERHHYDSQFAALILAICTLTVLQPRQAQDSALLPDDVKPDDLLQNSIRLHSGTQFGQAPTLEAILTSTFLFACHFCLGQDNAAWVRLREAITLGEILGLHDPSAYQNVGASEKDRRQRAYLCLTILERVYALQRKYPVYARMKPTQQISSFFDDIRSASHASETEEHNAIDGLRDMINTFDSVDDVLINCRNKSCDLSRLGTGHVSPQRLCLMMRKYTAPDDVAGPMGTEWPVTRGADGDGLPVMNRKKLAQRSDILITRQWMRNQLWKVANWHSYLHIGNPEPELRPAFVIEIAKDTLRICGMFSISLMEVHGVGLVSLSQLRHHP